MRILIFVLAVPLLEIVILIKVGSFIGAWAALALLVLTALAGALLIRHAGVKTLFNARASLRQHQESKTEVLDAICFVLAGLMLIIPGFLTDILGLLLLAPLTRRLITKYFLRMLEKSSPFDSGDKAKRRPGVTIEGDFTEVDQDRKPPNNISL